MGLGNAQKPSSAGENQLPQKQIVRLSWQMNAQPSLLSIAFVWQTVPILLLLGVAQITIRQQFHYISICKINNFSPFYDWKSALQTSPLYVGKKMKTFWRPCLMYPKDEISRELSWMKAEDQTLRKYYLTPKLIKGIKCITRSIYEDEWLKIAQF